MYCKYKNIMELPFDRKAPITKAEIKSMDVVPLE
jgi:hypothetical protein